MGKTIYQLVQDLSHQQYDLIRKFKSLWWTPVDFPWFWGRCCVRRWGRWWLLIFFSPGFSQIFIYNIYIYLHIYIRIAKVKSDIQIVILTNRCLQVEKDIVSLNLLDVFLPKCQPRFDLMWFRLFKIREKRSNLTNIFVSTSQLTLQCGLTLAMSCNSRMEADVLGLIYTIRNVSTFISVALELRASETLKPEHVESKPDGDSFGPCQSLTDRARLEDHTNGQ